MVQILSRTGIDATTLNLDLNKLPYHNPDNFFRDKTLIGLVEKGGFSLDPSTQTPHKIKVLKTLFGYTHLKGPGGYGIELTECKSTRVGNAFNNQYLAAKNRMGLLGKISSLVHTSEQ